MKTFDKAILMFILFTIFFTLGNLSSKLFDIESSFKNIFGKSTTTKQNQQVPIKSAINTDVKKVSSVTANKITNTTQALIKKLGESYRLSNMEYKVISAINKGTSYEHQTTTGKFIFVKILISNVGKINSKGSILIIKDKNDRQFKQKEYFSFAYNSGLKQYSFNMFDDGMAPGFSETYTAVFEVAKDSTDLKLCHPSTTGKDIVCVPLGI